MKIDQAYDAVFNYGQAARRRGRSWFIYREAEEALISKVEGLGFRDLLASRKEIYYPSPADIMANDWETIVFTFGRVDDGK